jgi:glutamate-1-semialdehyde 2,1-aminomutase
VVRWNDLAALERALEAHAGTVAAVIMEPVNYNSGTLLPQPGYLERVRELTHEQGVVLIFDEILSGFRTGPGGMQAYFGVTPDLCTLGKALGGGLPLSAFGGRREVMQAVAPLGKAVHSGTFNAHLVPILAAKAFLETVSEPSFYPRLEAAHAGFYAELRGVFQRAGLPVWVGALGARFSLLFGLEQQPSGYAESAAWDREMATRFFGFAMEEGVYFHFAWHHGLSAAHGPAEIGQALEGIERAARRTARQPG